MLNPGKKFSLCATKKMNSCVVRKKNSERNKNHTPPPPFQVKWSVPYIIDFNCFLIHWKLS